MTEQAATTASLSEILLSYDWSPVTKSTIETLGVSIPLATPAVPSAHAVANAFAAMDDANVKPAEAYAKALDALATATAKVVTTREALEAKAGHTVAAVSAELVKTQVSECATHKAMVTTKTAFLTALVEAVPLDDAEVTAAKAVIEYAQAKVRPSTVKPTGSAKVPSLRDKLVAAGFEVGQRGRISEELKAAAASL